MSKDEYKYYIEDINVLIKEKAIEARKKVVNQNDDYNKGYLMAYYEIVSLIKEQAETFNLDLREIKLHDINPDRDLLI